MFTRDTSAPCGAWSVQRPFRPVFARTVAFVSEGRRRCPGRRSLRVRSGPSHRSARASCGGGQVQLGSSPLTCSVAVASETLPRERCGEPHHLSGSRSNCRSLSVILPHRSGVNKRSTDNYTGIVGFIPGCLERVFLELRYLIRCEGELQGKPSPQMLVSTLTDAHSQKHYTGKSHT